MEVETLIEIIGVGLVPPQPIYDESGPDWVGVVPPMHAERAQEMVAVGLAWFRPSNGLQMIFRGWRGSAPSSRRLLVCVAPALAWLRPIL